MDRYLALSGTPDYDANAELGIRNTRLPHTCWNPAPLYVLFNYCWGIAAWPPTHAT